MEEERKGGGAEATWGSTEDVPRRPNETTKDVVDETHLRERTQALLQEADLQTTTGACQAEGKRSGCEKDAQARSGRDAKGHRRTKEDTKWTLTETKTTERKRRNVDAVRGIRKQLESEFGVGLADKKAVIREEVDAFLEQNLLAQNGDQDPHEVKDETRTEAEEPTDEFHTQTNQGSKRKSGAFGSLLSPNMAAFVGQEEMPRTQVVKFLWKYIKENDLQDPSNRRKINLDEKLASLFTPPLNMLNMNKQLSKHVFQREAEPAQKKKKVPKNKSNASAKDTPKGIKSVTRSLKVKEKKARNHPLFLMSPELQAFFGTGEREMARPVAVKHIWDYIREHNLQNPADKRQILLDAKLGTIFEAPVDMFSMNKQLSRHLKSLQQ